MFLSILTVFTFSLSDALILHSIFSIIDLLIFNRFELITFLQSYNVLITCFLVWLIKNTTREQHAREQHCTRDFILYIWCQSCPQSRQINMCLKCTLGNHLQQGVWMWPHKLFSCLNQILNLLFLLFQGHIISILFWKAPTARLDQLNEIIQNWILQKCQPKLKFWWSHKFFYYSFFKCVVGAFRIDGNAPTLNRLP